MAFKATFVLDNTGHSKEQTALLDARGIDRETSGAPFSQGPIPPTIVGPGNRYLDHDDYHIALMPRQEHESPTGMCRPSALSRFFLLPLTWQQLLARMRSDIMSAIPANRGDISQFGEVRVNFVSMRVTKSDQPVVLTAQQFKLLKFLMQSPDQVFSRDELLQQVWGYNHYPSTRTVDNHICSLRQSLEVDQRRPLHFLTVRRMGYKFVP
jgi:transcriptional regulator